MSKRVVVDPVTRIEGHLRVEAILDDKNVISDAISSGTSSVRVRFTRDWQKCLQWRGVSI